MKFFVAFAALIAVAVATHKPAFNEEADIAAIIAAIHSPSTDPATAALLEQQLEAILSGGSPVIPEPISITDAISIGPAIIDFPLPESALAPTVPVAPSPVVVGPIAPGQPAPLVQLIVNVNNSPLPISIDDFVPQPDPVIVVDGPTVDPVQVVDVNPEVVEPVQIVDVVPTPVVEPVQVVDVVPVVIEPVQIGAPIIPEPAVNLPDELN